jgi:hypothetical protein
MTGRKTQDSTYDPLDHFLRMVLFVVMTSIGMAGMGLAFLAQPLSQYMSDRQKRADHEQAIENLEKLVDQQEALLANAESPAVAERIAINHYRYQPIQAALGQTEPLQSAWPELTHAVSLAATDTLEIKDRYEPLPFQKFTMTLAAQPKSQNLLALLGAILVLISLTFFGYRRATPKE